MLIALLSPALAKPPVFTVGEFKLKVKTVHAWLTPKDEVRLNFYDKGNVACDPDGKSFAYESVILAPRDGDDGRYWTVDAVFSEGGTMYGANVGRFTDAPKLATEGAEAFMFDWKDPEAAGDDIGFDLGGEFAVVPCGADAELKAEKASKPAE